MILIADVQTLYKKLCEKGIISHFIMKLRQNARKRSINLSCNLEKAEEHIEDNMKSNSAVPLEDFESIFRLIGDIEF